MKQNENFSRIVLFSHSSCGTLCKFSASNSQFWFWWFSKNFWIFYPIGFPYNLSIAIILTPAGSCQTIRKHKFLACDKFLLIFSKITIIISHYNKIISPDGVVKKLFLPYSSHDGIRMMNYDCLHTMATKNTNLEPKPF